MNLAESELISFFKHNGIKYRAEDGGYAFVMSQLGCKWKTVCRFTDNAVMFYGMYPFHVNAADEALALINAINGEVVRGAFFLKDNVVVMRTSTVLCDIYTAFEEITVALEYNAGYVAHFWARLMVLQR
ncbi:hypothetical protein FACS1894133_1600 [Clostridia bacterium]|nr:hypothetical protein FACS1894133_1600 [Clostridia bacterium]